MYCEDGKEPCKSKGKGKGKCHALTYQYRYRDEYNSGATHA